MRTILIGLAVFVAAWLGLGAVAAGERDDARVRARVREYTDAAAGDLRRDLVVRELAGADATLVARVVREALLSDARRPAAADLASRLRLAGVFDLAKRWADGPAAPHVARLALAAPEPAAAEWIAARWAAEDPPSERFRVCDEALRSARAPPAVVERIAPSLGDAARCDAAVAVLREQMGVDDPCAAALLARWPEAWRCYVFEAREFPREGEDLLAAPGWRVGRARRVGRNLRLGPSSSIDLVPLPPPAQADSGVLRLRVAPGGGAGAFVALRTAGGAQELRVSCDGAAWWLVEGPPREGARVEAPCRPAEWADVEFRISDPALRDRPGVRDVRVLVDGAELRPSGGFWRLASPPASLAVGASCGRPDAGASGGGADGATPASTCVGGVTWRALR